MMLWLWSVCLCRDALGRLRSCCSSGCAAEKLEGRHPSEVAAEEEGTVKCL
jgi:hypothetical protein